MSVHVFDNDDGRVDHNTGHKNQCKKSHPIQGVTHDVVDEERQAEGGGDGQEDDRRPTPAHGQEDHDHGQDNGQGQV